MGSFPNVSNILHFNIVKKLRNLKTLLQNMISLLVREVKCKLQYIYTFWNLCKKYIFNGKRFWSISKRFSPFLLKIFINVWFWNVAKHFETFKKLFQWFKGFDRFKNVTKLEVSKGFFQGLILSFFKFVQVSETLKPLETFN